MKHTPGKWERYGSTIIWSPTAKQVVAQVSEPVPDCRWVSFQEPSLGGPNRKTIVANAILITAAPDLLSSLQALLAIPEILEILSMEEGQVTLSDAKEAVTRATSLELE